MWLMTTIGFFSVVINERDHDWQTFQIRARARTDLENFLRAAGDLDDAEALGVKALEIIDTPHADYPHRVICPRAILADVVNVLIAKIDYANFKDAVEQRRGKGHAKAYLKVWSALHDLEEPGSRLPAAVSRYTARR